MSEQKEGMKACSNDADIPSKHGRAGSCQQNREALQRLNLEVVTRNLILRQIRESSVHAGVSIMTLLRRCLESNDERSSVVALSGYTEHFQSRVDEDLGWGCGWRNIQMLSSYMLAQDPECKEVLMGGAGFVPNFAAIQQWLEIAWLKGFDVLGADYFDWRIRDTKKWIGTTECAAVMRSFGMLARIVDFRTAPSKRGTNCLEGQGESRSEKPIYQGSSIEDEESNNFSRLSLSSSSRRSDDNTNPSHEPSSPTPPAEEEEARDSPEEHRLIVLPDQKEELHFLR
uniref:UFSP1/2/DUB catalytic domain-containing protein n=1 Tax=Physcomitrium patens TaxID=3218 RepID=A0A2K1IHS1_PHYPA|nr:zinc finger with UFM1-specific peptidase domain protein-like [Physcomitrium patens]PNR28823.1 hypothetical protein PHYPA_027515 [Physcomitrium patens]|eukprot:XP_024362945.1 zinc finger with UFM1-specific peptidase domain protein-like [Physcomitrella patens]